MPATILSAEAICSDSQMLLLAGGERVGRSMPKVQERDAARAQALDDVVDSLAGRSPPIRESDLTNPAELKHAVAYRALQIIMRNSMSGAGSLHGDLMAEFAREYSAAIRRNYTVSGGLTGPSGGTFTVERC